MKPKTILYLLLALALLAALAFLPVDNNLGGWTLFEGWKEKGRVQKVVLRGKIAFKNGSLLVNPGYGKMSGNCGILMTLFPLGKGKT